MSDQTTVEKFDYWQRRMKAEALEEAADWLADMQAAEAHIGQAECDGPHGACAAYALYEKAVEDPEQWLRDRAQNVRDGSME